MEGEGRGSGAQVAAWLQEFSIDQTIGAGLNEDIERIIYLAYDEFEKQEGPRFKLFIEVWQKTCLGQIFSGRESFREMFERMLLGVGSSPFLPLSFHFPYVPIS